MMRLVNMICFGPLLNLCCFVNQNQADSFDDDLRPLLVQNCVACHGEGEANAEINFEELIDLKQWVEQPMTVKRVLDAIDTRAMPPEGEAPLAATVRQNAVRQLKLMLRAASVNSPPVAEPLRRLNRFQYNNTVRDLFQLDRDIFALPEKLMTRYDNYLHGPDGDLATVRMPETVRVASHSLQPLQGLKGIRPFPKDLRAEHGFDNQANQLTLSPLLLDAFLRLSVSIVESPDFNRQSVGIWDEYFASPPKEKDVQSEVRQRLAGFLRMAFRGPVDDETIDRYTAYALSKMDDGLSYTDGMKKVAAAALSSPMFLYRAPPTIPAERQFALASRLSYCLWGSCPDEELLQLAELGQLSHPKKLDATIKRMLLDPKIERFLDSFPSQWMQLENALAATPDPQINRYFRLDANQPASLQMVLEPLLLFDVVFLEDRPIVELVTPEFSYQSEFLKTWYTSELQPPPVDADAIIAQNQRNDLQRRRLEDSISNRRTQLEELVRPIRMRLLRARGQDASVVDLKPYAVWNFNGDLSESVRGLDLTAHGEIAFDNGSVVLERSYLLSKPLPIDLKSKTLEVWFRLKNLDQPGGGLMGIQGRGDFFDTIVIGERKRRHWISGSNGFSRTLDFPESMEETATDDLLHLAMVYAEDGTTTLFRNGEQYGRPYRKGQATFPREESAVIFGLRHVPPGGNRYLNVSIEQAQLYDRALTAQEVKASTTGHGSFISDRQLLVAMSTEQLSSRKEILTSIDRHRTELERVATNVDPGQAIQAAQRRYDEELLRQLRLREFHRVSARDPRYGGVITNAAMLSMTSGPKRTHPVARGVWISEVIFNNPPSPPPNDVPPLDEEAEDKDLTVRERFAAHRENPSCAGCHSQLDPLGFALENFDITGRWRDAYHNGRVVDSSGTLMRVHQFRDVKTFKSAMISEEPRFAKAFTEHLMRFATARELVPADSVAVEDILSKAENDGFRLRDLLHGVLLSSEFLQLD